MIRTRTTTRLDVRPRGFTLVEMLVAVAAVVLIALGITRVFSAVGKTVQIGRRVSNLNAYASVLESQMRRDIASMTRDGFFVIRNEKTPVPVKLSADDDAPNFRRIDQMVFFDTGDFTSLRDPVQPDRVAKASAARIWWGHGLRARPGLAPGSNVYLPGPMPPAGPRSQQPYFGDGSVTDNPNLYASDWILMRQATLLVGSSASPPLERDLLPSSSGFTVDQQRDGPYQYQLQPAASSIFRDLTTALDPPSGSDWVRVGRQGAYPCFESGIVDIATTDLTRIRSIILDAQPPVVRGTRIPNGPNDPPFLSRDGDPGATFTPTSSGNVTVVDNMHAWMRQAFPANSDPPGTNPADPSGYWRMRCELTPPDLLGDIQYGGGTIPPTAVSEQINRDQQMLIASNIAPHCTQFKIEWSFGAIDPDTSAGGGPTVGNVIWYGGDNTTSGAGRSGFLSYPQGTSNQLVLVPFTYQGSGLSATGAPTEGLIHGNLSAQPNSARVLYSYFGYVDPTYSTPPVDPATDRNGNGKYDPDLGESTKAPKTVPWPWPKMIRVTIGLVDPTAPDNEQTYQFVFELPKDGRF